MDVKRLFRGPLLWIILGSILVLTVLQLVSSSGGYQDIDTSAMVQKIQAGDVKSVTFVDGDQVVEATTTGGDKVSAQWVTGQGVQLVDMAQRAQTAGNLESYDVE